MTPYFLIHLVLGVIAVLLGFVAGLTGNSVFSFFGGCIVGGLAFIAARRADR